MTIQDLLVEMTKTQLLPECERRRRLEELKGMAIEKPSQEGHVL